MSKTINYEGKVYKIVPDIDTGNQCNGCVAHIPNRILCENLSNQHDCFDHRCIFVLDETADEITVDSPEIVLTKDVVKTVLRIYVNNDSIGSPGSAEDKDHEEKLAKTADQIINVYEQSKIASSEEYAKYLELKRKYSHLD